MARRGYPAEFRRRVVDLVEGGTKVSQVATELGVSEQTGDVIACDLSSKSAHDSTRVVSLVGRSSVRLHQREPTLHTMPAASMRQSTITAPIAHPGY